MQVFHSVSCHRCAKVKQEVLPQLQQEFKARLTFEYRDIAEIKNYQLLLGLQKQHNAIFQTVLPVFYFQGEFVNGKGATAPRLRQFLLRGLRTHQATPQGGVPPVELTEYFRRLKPVAIIGAGLIDGINPCAFAVIIFFLSFLTLQGYGRRALALIGSSFILAVFLTYFLIGLGIFDLLYRLEGFWLVSRTLNVTIGALSLVFGVLSLYDAWKFKKSGQTEGMILQLPKAVKNQIHAVIGRYYRRPKDSSAGTPSVESLARLVVSALVTGFLVSLLESICTGQTYIPTVTFVLKTTPMKLEALGYLLLYNLMFILPLVVILCAGLAGTSASHFSRLMQRHLFLIKLLLAFLFLGLGGFLLWRR